jgi:exopolyphosphatase / guanosine-5'-triphosphate,3'-diphosphate pyrophosphatase
MLPRVAPLSSASPERRLAVIDMGSNTFRLVVFRYRPGGAFRLVDELRDAVRLSAGAGAGGITAAAVERAGHTAQLYAAFCAAGHIDEVDAVTTSAARDAANRGQVLSALTAGGRLPVRVLSEREEARYGYLGAANSTTLTDGWVLDLGGGSVQATEVTDRRMGRSASRPLGAVRMTEAFLSDDDDAPARGRLKALRKHAQRSLDETGWIGDAGPRVIGVGGTVRTLARMAQKAERYPLDELHGYLLRRDALREVAERMAELPPAGRGALPGLKADRADITLAGAIVIGAAMDLAGADRIEICGQGLREGVFYERLLAGRRDEPLIDDVRRHSVLNLMDAYRCDLDHCLHVADLALSLYDQMAALHLFATDPGEREILWAAAMLHDAGVSVDYNDHHKHGYYLVLNSGLPGYRHDEIALVALLVRSHRKGLASSAPLEGILPADGRERLNRLAACLRLAEQIAQSRGAIAVRLTDDGDCLHASVVDRGDPAVAVWSAGRESPALQRGVGRRLRVSAA